MSNLQRSFAADLHHFARIQPDRIAVIDARTGNEITYAALFRLLERFAVLFEQKGIRAGTPVLAILPNSIEMLAAFLGAVRVGIDFVPLSPDQSSAEIQRIAKLTKPALCLLGEAATEQVIKGVEATQIASLRLALDSSFSWLPEGSSRAAEPARAARLFLSTSGTTGEPRAMVMDIDRLWSSGCAFVRHHRFLDSGARFMNILPMSYLGGLFNLTLIPLAAGGSTVVCESFSGKSFLNFWQQVEAFDVTVLWVVPTIVRGLLMVSGATQRMEHAALAKVRAAFLGTAPIDLATKTQFERTYNIPLLENFALSETTFFTSETLDTRFRRVERSVGEVLSFAELRMAPVGQAEDGPTVNQISVRTPFLFLGYLQSDGKIALPVDGDGFFPTGDVGHLENGDLLVIDGRIRDIVKKGGQLVVLREIELAAQQCPAVREAAAVAITHSFYGEAFDLYVRPAEGAAPADAVAQVGPWLRQNLSRYKWPEAIHAVADFPRTASGKIQKHELKKPAERQ